MFYEKQNKAQKEYYKQLLGTVGGLTRLFSDDDIPYLPYRCHENIFCRAFDAENLARHDCSADAKKGNIGIGLKTWRGNDDQKVAEFGKLKELYADKSGLELVKAISEYRNARIRVTMNMYGIDKMMYSIIKRVPGEMKVFECAFDEIDIDNIRLIDGRGNSNNTYFTDGRHTYHFSTSKNTLYMIFDNMSEEDSFKVDIMEDPYSFLSFSDNDADLPFKNAAATKHESICLRLYSIRDGKEVVFEKSGLNQWNAGGRARNPNELYIPYPAEDRSRNPDFFPPRDVSFVLRLPNGEEISAKVCQENSKAIMSNPNLKLGQWLLRDVLNLPEWQIVTYDMLKILDISCVIFQKIRDDYYAIEFAPVGTYEQFYGDNKEDD